MIQPPSFNVAPGAPSAAPAPAGSMGPSPTMTAPMGLQPAGNVVQLGTMRATPLSTVLNREDEARAAQERQAQPLITGIAAHISQAWSIARDAKRNSGIEDRMLRNMRARRGEYDPDKMAAIRAMGGSDVYAGITSVKCRAAAGWIRDVMLGTGVERPWEIRPTPIPELPADINQMIVNAAAKPIAQATMMGQPVDDTQVVQIVSTIRDQAMAAVREEADERARRMADKMEDQLVEGGFLEAMDDFVDDIVTFPTAIIKGPVIRRQPTLKWEGSKPVVEENLTVCWERVSPFDFYPCPTMEHVQKGSLIQKHRLSRYELQQLKGVEGYDSGAIDTVLTQYSRGLNAWLYDTSLQSEAEGHATIGWATNPDELIDALQYWGTIQGQMLLDWGMKPAQVPDPTREYHVEAWLIGAYVIKAVLNYDPLCRKPYYCASYESVPGNIWGNSVADLVRDPQVIANATARALVNNMAMASGPQVGIKVDRLAAGEVITQLTPWRIWQMTTDPVAGSTDKAIEFFQPESNAQELMAVYDRWSTLADEYSGIPRYLTGDTTGGAGRTASGLSMLISNAGKSIKQVIGNIDIGVFKPMLERLYYHNMRYENDPELKGDVQIIARGANALVAKESAQVRRQEFLAATANPIDMQIVGVEGRANILREVAKGLDMNTDRIVPPPEVLRQKLAAQAALMQQQPGGQPPPEKGPSAPGQTLMDGAPQTDNFSPPKG